VAAGSSAAPGYGQPRIRDPITGCQVAMEFKRCRIRPRNRRPGASGVARAGESYQVSPPQRPASTTRVYQVSDSVSKPD